MGHQPTQKSWPDGFYSFDVYWLQATQQITDHPSWYNIGENIFPSNVFLKKILKTYLLIFFFINTLVIYHVFVPKAINVLLKWWPLITNEQWPKTQPPGQKQSKIWTRMTISSLNFLYPTKPQLLLELINWTSATSGANKQNLRYSWS